MNRKKFCEYFEIPYMTLSDWEHGKKRVPKYFLRLLAYYMKMEQLNKEKEEAVEFWYARDLMTLLGYVRWENFYKAIESMIDSCKASEIEPADHFRSVTKMIQIGSGAERAVKDYMLTRYACYLIAQNGDPRKEEIAFAQSYFAVQARKQELIEERIAYIERTEARGKLRESEKRLSQNIYERGVDDAGFGRIRSRGDQALFGGKSTQEMKLVQESGKLPQTM